MPKKSEIQKAVKDPEWQEFRESLKGKSTGTKMNALSRYKREHPGPKTEVQVENYKNALRRGGQLPPKKK